MISSRNWHNSISIATGLRTGWLGFDSLERQDIFAFSTASKPTLGHIQPLIQMVPGAPSQGQVGKVAGAWSWPLHFWSKMIELYLNSPVHFYGMALNYLSSGTTLLSCNIFWYCQLLGWSIETLQQETELTTHYFVVKDKQSLLEILYWRSCHSPWMECLSCPPATIKEQDYEAGSWRRH